MNTERDKIRRLLHHLPYTTLKSCYNYSGNRQEIIDQIVDDNPLELIKNVFINNFNWTKQYIHIYSTEVVFTPAIMNNFPFHIFRRTEDNALGVFRYSFWNEFVVNVILFNEFANAQVVYLQPFQIVFKDNLMFLHITKIEDDALTFFQEDRSPRKAGIENGHDSIKKILDNYFYDNLGISMYDLNKGTKELWENDIIDARKLKYKDSSSIETSIMDEQYTFKNRYPERFQSIMEKPLERTQYKNISGNDNLCEAIEIEPVLGFINILRFPKSENQIRNVVNEILNRNL